MSGIDLPSVERLQAVSVESGDTIVATIPRETKATSEDLERVHDRVQNVFPDNEVLVVCGVSLTVGRVVEDA